MRNPSHVLKSLEESSKWQTRGEPDTLRGVRPARGGDSVETAGCEAGMARRSLPYDAVWNRVSLNRTAHKTTWVYIDEMHVLLKDEQTASYTIELWKRFRKWGGIPSGLTQNITDLLSSPEIGNIFQNSDFVYLLSQGPGDRQILAKQLGISPHQLSYLSHSSPGEGLMIFGKTIIPFQDRFPLESKLYSIMTSKLF
jgi:hypothetical protein